MSVPGILEARFPRTGIYNAAENVTLLYPCTDKIDQSKDIRFISHEEHDRIEIKIRFVDLFDIKKSLENIIAEISSTGSC